MPISTRQEIIADYFNKLKSVVGGFVEELRCEESVSSIKSYQSTHHVKKQYLFESFLTTLSCFEPNANISTDRSYETSQVNLFDDLMTILNGPAAKHDNNKTTIPLPNLLQELSSKGHDESELTSFNKIYRLFDTIDGNKNTLKDPVVLQGINVRSIENFIADIFFNEKISLDGRWFLYMFCLRDYMKSRNESSTGSTLFNTVLEQVICSYVLIPVLIQLQTLLVETAKPQRGIIKIDFKEYEKEIMDLVEFIAKKLDMPCYFTNSDDIFRGMKMLGVTRLSNSSIERYQYDMREIVKYMPGIPQMIIRIENEITDTIRDKEKVTEKAKLKVKSR